MEDTNHCSSKGILTRNQKKMLSEKTTEKPSNSDKKKIKIKEKQTNISKEVTKEEFQIPVEDLVIWRGDGIFEAIGIHQGFLFALEEHIERFKKSAQKSY